MTQSAPPHIFGIRHHGPGSARSLRAALEALQPDALLIEGPPEASELIALASQPDMQPPVALLVYRPDQPQQAAFYPFAVFSPEWQALCYGIERDITTRFIDLPQQHWMALRQDEVQAAAPDDQPSESPLDALARAAGMQDGEAWWERVIEERGDGEQAFPAILEAMSALRQDTAPHDPLEPLREAAMRKAIRQARKEGATRIAVVCGAWHAPALLEDAPARADNDLLKGLPRVKVSITWVPWSYGHLARASGYGAGITSPGWYEHLWTTPQQTAVRWLGRVAQLLRAEDMDASAAQVIDAVRLAESLAALRGRSRPGLDELNQATRAVFCLGDALPLELIRQRLVVGDRLGTVAAGAAAVPLQQDLAAAQKRLRFPPEAERRSYDLDLRRPNDLARSHLLHRLNVLNIPWGKPQGAASQRGTFHELWAVQWRPELAVAVIEAAMWGNTVEQAATVLACHQAAQATDLTTVTALLERVFLADLAGAAGDLVRALQAHTALSGDIASLMSALPPLARIVRYGSVRLDHQQSGDPAFSSAEIERVASGLALRVCIGLPLACASLDDDAARQMMERIEGMHTGLTLLQNQALLDEWIATLEKLAEQSGLHGLLSGRCCRILYDRDALTQDELARRLRLGLSPANPPAQSAAWLEGLLRGSGLLLLHDDTLWAILDAWVTALPGDAFNAVLPVLRRTFSAFAAPERRQMGERARHGATAPGVQSASDEIDLRRADAVLPRLAELLGVRAYADR